VPSPLGHALGGLAAGWLVAGRPTPLERTALQQAIWFVSAGMAPDVDLLFGIHRGPSHSVVAACLVGLATYLVARRGRLAVAMAAAYASHPLLDWLGHDASPPIGLMALWPFSHDYYESPAHFFHAISRRYGQPEFWPSNLRALLRELLVLGPIAAFVAFVRRVDRQYL